MILNPNNTEAFVFSRSRTVNPPHGDLVLSGVSIGASPNLDILGVKFYGKLTFEDHVRGIVSRVSRKIYILRLVKRVLWTRSVFLRCCYAFVLPILEYCSPVWGSAAKCHLQLYSSARYIRWPGYFKIRVSCCVIDVMWLSILCFTRLIRTLITVCSASFHLLLLEFGISELQPQLIHLSLKYQMSLSASRQALP